jgi:hypothetical protein
VAKEKKLKVLALIIVTGFVYAVTFHVFLGNYFHLGYPFNTFLFMPNDRFMDFFNPLRGSFDRDPYNPERIHFIGGYLPFGYFVTFLFSLIKPWFISFALFISSFLVYLNYYIIKVLYKNDKRSSMERFYIFILALITYPVLMVVDRANFDIVIFFFISLFALFYQSEKYTLAILLLAFPVAMKGYPLVLFTIPLLDRRIKDVFFSCLLVAFLEIASLSLFKDGLVMEFNKMLVSFGSAYSIAFGLGSLIRFNSSIYTFLLFILKSTSPSLATDVFFNWAYIIFVMAVFGIITIRMFLKNYPFWRKLLTVILMMILFPQSSADYRLLMLYPPLILFLALEESNPFDYIFIGLFGLILIPKAYVILESDVNIGILLNPILLVLLLIVSVVFIKTPPKKLSIQIDDVGS